MTASRSEHHTKAFLMLVIANLFWGLSFPLIKATLLIEGRLIPGSSSLFQTLCVVTPRFVLAAAVMALVLGRQVRRSTKQELSQGIVIGLFASIGMLFQNDGMAYTAASTSAFLTQLYAILIPILLAVSRRRSPGLAVWASSALVLAGVAILGHFNWQAMSFGRGEWETLISSVFFMGQILWLDRKEFVGNRPQHISLIMFSVMAVIFLVLSFGAAPSAGAILLPWRSPAWVGMTLALTIFCTLGSFSLMNRWQPVLTATEAGLTYCIEPIFSALMALFLPALLSAWALINYPNEHATWTLLVGGGLITAANLLIQLVPQKKP